MNKHQIVDGIKRLNFPSYIEPIIDILEKNLERIAFVKEEVGLRNVLFLCEDEAKEEFGVSVFASFNVDIIPGNNEYNLVALEDSKIHEPDEVLDGLKNFFATTKETLFVTIGFKASLLSSEDFLKALYMIENNEIDDFEKGLRLARKFPDWYHAKFPFELEAEAEFLKKLEVMEGLIIEKAKEDIWLAIDESVKNNDKQTFYKLCEYYSDFLKK